MRRLRAWGMITVMGLFVAVLSGCGGGSIDPENTTEQNLTIPNDYPDTYDTGKVLEGSWQAIDNGSGGYDFSGTYFLFRLNSASLSFTSTDIRGTVAQPKITSHQEWHTNLISEDADIGINSLGLNFEGKRGTMIHQGRDSWRCTVNINDDSKIAMNITVISETLITVQFIGTSDVIYGNIGTQYDFTLTFRKEQYTL